MMRTLDPFARWAFFRTQIIGPADNPYLTRHVIARTPIGSIYIHRIHRPDADRHLHNHPWTFLGIVLRGRYTELENTLHELRGHDLAVRTFGNSGKHRPSRLRLVGVYTFKRARDDYHRIVEVWPNTCTLLFVGPKRNPWGFWVPGDGGNEPARHVPWREYLIEA